MKVDMSPGAVTARLKVASQLRRLCLALGKGRPVDRRVVQPSLSDPPAIFELPPESTDKPVSRRPRR